LTLTRVFESNTTTQSAQPYHFANLSIYFIAADLSLTELNLP
jgi:hypothetical protein